MERDIRCTVSEVSEPTASSSQNSLTGALVASSSQNSLTGTGVASSSQNSMTGGCGSCGSDPTTTGGETEGILGSVTSLVVKLQALLRTLKQVKFHSSV